MTKAELMEIAEKYDFKIYRHSVTNEALGIYKQCKPDAEIDKIIKDINAERNPAIGGEARYLGNYAVYTIVCPTTWFDLWGWK